MSKGDMTTTQGIFKVEDITFKNARKQSAIKEEIEAEKSEHRKQHKDDIKVPVSLTPEQVKSFLLKRIEYCQDSNEKRLYSQCLMWIDELVVLKRKYIDLEEKFLLAVQQKEDDSVETSVEDGE